MKYNINSYSFTIKFPIKIAKTFMSRFAGLMGKKHLTYGLLLIPCNSIHTYFMKIPIDVLYLNESFTVIDIQTNLQPWKIGKYNRKTHSILELPAGLADRLQIAVGQHIFHQENEHTTGNGEFEQP